MTVIDRHRPIPDGVLEEAVNWFYRLEEMPDESVRAIWQRWMEADEAHARAWQLTAHAWAISAQAIDPGRIDGRGSATSVVPKRSKPHWKIGAAATLAACLAFIFVMPEMRNWVAADYATGTGEMRSVPLADSSIVSLDADSAITVDLSGTTRAIDLLEGSVYFDVAKDQTRPFVVRAGDLTVTVTGTAFEVGMTDQTLSVAVAEGAVLVTPNGGGPIRMVPGQRVSQDRQTGQIVRAAVATEDIALWQTGRLVVQGGSFNDVVDVLRRYHTGAIVLADETLEQRVVTGVYDLRDPLRALQALVEPYGSSVRKITPYLIVIGDL